MGAEILYPNAFVLMLIDTHKITQLEFLDMTSQFYVHAQIVSYSLVGIVICKVN